jgi:hypothetical protein
LEGPLVSVSIAVDDTGRNLFSHWWWLLYLWLCHVLGSAKRKLCVSASKGLSWARCFPISYAGDYLWGPKTMCTFPDYSLVCFCSLGCNTHLSSLTIWNKWEI